MSEISITEHKVIELWYDLEYVYTKRNKSEILDNFLGDVFSDCGLKLTEFSSPAFKTIKRRCERIIDRIRDNKQHQKPQYHGFSDPEKTFFSEREFPQLCKKDVTKR